MFFIRVTHLRWRIFDKVLHEVVADALLHIYPVLEKAREEDRWSDGEVVQTAT